MLSLLWLDLNSMLITKDMKIERSDESFDRWVEDQRKIGEIQQKPQRVKTETPTKPLM